MHFFRLNYGIFMGDDEIAGFVALFEVIVGHDNDLRSHESADGALNKGAFCKAFHTDELTGKAQRAEAAPADENESALCGNVLVAHGDHAVGELFGDVRGGGSGFKGDDFTRVVGEASESVFVHFGNCLLVHFDGKNAGSLLCAHLLGIVALVDSDRKASVAGEHKLLHGVLKLGGSAVAAGASSLIIGKALSDRSVDIKGLNTGKIVVLVGGSVHDGTKGECVCDLLGILGCKIDCHKFFPP